MCIFPETRRKDDFVSITYNSNIDTVLTDIENDEVYLQFRDEAPMDNSTLGPRRTGHKHA